MHRAHQAFLEKNALRAARAKMAAGGKAKITKAEFLSTRFQIIDPLWRLLGVSAGLFVGGMAIWLQLVVGNPWLTGFVALVAVAALVSAAVGRTKTIEEVLSDAADVLFESLLDAL